MIKSRMEQGVHVIITDNPFATEKTHQLNPAMRRMCGGKYIIDRVTDSKYGMAAIIGGYYWDPIDLLEESPRKKSHKFHFNVEELIV